MAKFLKLFTLAVKNVFKTLVWDGKGINVDNTYLYHLRCVDDSHNEWDEVELEHMPTEKQKYSDSLRIFRMNQQTIENVLRNVYF